MIDIGANLANSTFLPDLDQVLDRAKKAGVRQIVVTGSDMDSATLARELARKHPEFLYATAGLHPHHASSFNPELLATFTQLLQYPEVVAIGETGLDYFRDFSPREDQQQSFIAHLELAETVHKPLFLHERDSFEDFRAIMQSHSTLCERAIVHCFTGNLSALKTYLDMGMYIGITGWICDKNRGAELREIINYAPLDRLMIETDAPYLTPHIDGLKKQLVHKHRNEPWTLQYTAGALADALNLDEETVRKTTTDTARKFFSLEDKSS